MTDKIIDNNIYLWNFNKIIIITQSANSNMNNKIIDNNTNI